MGEETMGHPHNRVLNSYKKKEDNLYELIWSDFGYTVKWRKLRAKAINFQVCYASCKKENTQVYTHLCTQNTGITFKKI